MKTLQEQIEEAFQQTGPDALKPHCWQLQQ
jgi:hypothetical protein